MKHLLPALLLGFMPLVARAQTAPGWIQASVLTDPAGAFITPSLAADATGNTYVAGGFSQTITLAAGTTLTTQGGQDGYVAKYGPTGNLLWYRQLAGTGADYFQALVTDASGGVSLLGAAGDGAQLGTTTFAASSFGSSLVLARLDAQGAVLGLQEIGTGSLLAATSLARDPAGNLYLSGRFALDATFGSFSLSTPIGGTGYALDQFVVKLSATGTPLWAQQGGRVTISAGTYTPLFSSHLVAGAGGVYLNWTCNAAAGGFGSLALPAGLGDYDGLAVKFDLQGNPLWAKRVGGAGADYSSYGQLDAAGRFVLPGFSTAAGYFNNPSTVNNNIVSNGYVTVLDPATGAAAWTNTLVATSGGAFRDVAADASGNIYAAGHFVGQGTLGSTTLTSAGGFDAVVASYSANGTLRWTQKSSGTGDEIPAAIALDGTSRLTLVGGLSGSGQFGSVAVSAPVSTNGLASPFVARLGSIVTATRAGQAVAPLALYPNPAATTSGATLPALPVGTQLTLLNAVGRVVRQQVAAPTLSLAGLAPGFYEVQAVAPSGAQWTSRLVVE